MKGRASLNPTITQTGTRLERDSSLVVTRLHAPNPSSRIPKIIRRVVDLDDAGVERALAETKRGFSHRHKNLDEVFAAHLDMVREHIPDGVTLGAAREALVGACFTMEYAVSSAALFNPSIVPHPDQSGVDPGALRFVMSLRATGEGHISSIVFRTGMLTADNQVLLDPPSRYAQTQNVYVNPAYDRHLFELKLNEMDASNEITAHVLGQLPDPFTYNEMRGLLDRKDVTSVFSEARQAEAREILFWLANSNYTMDFDPASLLSERVIFPVSDNESCGIEDARFVRFVDDDGRVTYYATYTAYNGYAILPQLIETRDFNLFKVATLNGNAVRNKGMALFPRKTGGQYVMLSRQDGENNRIMFSDNLHFWQQSEILQEPGLPWEFIQVGNCGAPLETPEGWLVLTHGVGPMRRYCIGAMLLDLDDPRRVVRRLRTPLLVPQEEDRDGYVPNVVYSCGSLIHNGVLVIPYAMSDTCSDVATVGLADLIQNMEPHTDVGSQRRARSPAPRTAPKGSGRT